MREGTRTMFDGGKKTKSFFNQRKINLCFKNRNKTWLLFVVQQDKWVWLETWLLTHEDVVPMLYHKKSHLSQINLVGRVGDVSQMLRTNLETREWEFICSTSDDVSLKDSYVIMIFGFRFKNLRGPLCYCYILLKWYNFNIFFDFSLYSESSNLFIAFS